MKSTLDAAFELNKLVKYSIKKIQYSLKREGTSNRLREDIALGESGDRELHWNHWTFTGTLLQTILHNWAAFQEMWDENL